MEAAVRRWGGLGVFLALLALPLLTDAYTQYVCNLILVYVVIGIGLNILLGYAGQFAFAHSAFMGLGAYTTGLLMARLGVPVLVAVPMGGLVAALAGCVVGLPALRMSGLYLAMSTLAFTELMQWVFIHWKPITLGTDGVNVPIPTVFGWAFGSDKAVFYLILPMSFLMIVASKRLVESKLGRAFVTIRDSEILAQSVGINVAVTKTIAFAVSAFYAGVGGGLFAISLRYLVPDGFGLFQVIVHFSIVVIGGLGSLAGSIIGAVLLTALPELLRGFQALQEIIYGVLLVLVILFMPDGIAGFLRARRWLPAEVLVRGWHREKAAIAPGPQEVS